MTRVLTMFCLLFCCSCATTFHGDAHFPGGSPGCEQACKGQGMVMGAFVLAGEYSSACVCVPKGSVAMKGAGALGLASVGVITQMRAAQQQQAMHATR